MNRRFIIASTTALGLATLISACAPTDTSRSIVDVAAANGDLSTAVAAIEAAGLTATLGGDGPFTLFAPSNAAFAALPDGTVERLLEPRNRGQLVSVLTYHVLPDAVSSSDIAGQRLNMVTVQGQTVHLDGTAGVEVNDSTVTDADIPASNGVVHIIDQVLLPN